MDSLKRWSHRFAIDGVHLTVASGCRRHLQWQPLPWNLGAGHCSPVRNEAFLADQLWNGLLISAMREHDRFRPHNTLGHGLAVPETASPVNQFLNLSH